MVAGNIRARKNRTKTRKNNVSTPNTSQGNSEVTATEGS